MLRLVRLIVDVGAFKAAWRRPGPSHKLGDYPPGHFRNNGILIGAAMTLMIPAPFVPLWAGWPLVVLGFACLMASWSDQARCEIRARDNFARRHGIDIASIAEADRSARKQLRLRKEGRAK